MKALQKHLTETVGLLTKYLTIFCLISNPTITEFAFPASEIAKIIPSNIHAVNTIDNTSP